MAKSSKTRSNKNKNKQHSRSTSPQVNIPMQHALNGPNQHTIVADAINAGVWQLVSSGSKALTGRRNQNQGSGATAQQSDASAVVNASSNNVLDDPNSRTNTTLECGAEDPNASIGTRVTNTSIRYEHGSGRIESNTEYHCIQNRS